MRLIAGFSLFKGLLFLLLTAGVLHFLNTDLGEAGEKLVRVLHCDPEGRYAAKFLEKLGMITTKQLKELSAFMFLYAGLFITEGSGLLLNKQWAKYLTIAATGSLIPVEAYEMVEHFGVLKLLLLVANLAIVIFLIVNVRREGSSS
jgi:uncharacterized membrane protein (DUF2068 family)